VGSDPGTGPVYDGFISYSHAADDLLAPRLQAGLQRFAKPWWKRRAVRIFRDEASLSANPHLWSSITEAMDRSGWFVLLLSPDAAESEWVNREVEYWLEHKDRDRIIPVVTAGEFYWGEGDVAGDSVPPTLHGLFGDEPRWVDLRFARTEELLDLKNPQFSAAVADVASAIRGIPKDELQSEEVRQHRRTIRTAWGAAFALLVLVVVAGASAVYANGQRIEANEQRASAVVNAVEAEAQRDVAEQQTEVAEQQTEVAEQLAADARADSLAANAIAQLESNPELALLLAIESLDREAQPAAFSATHQALQQQRVLYQIDAPPTAVPISTAASGGISPSGDRLTVAGHGPSVEVWEVGGDQALWSFETPLEEGVLHSPRFTEDGSEVVVVLSPVWDYDPFRSGVPPPIDRLYVLDAETGIEVRQIAVPPCGLLARPSPMPVYVDLTAPFPWVTCLQATEDDPRGFVFDADVGLFDPTSGAFTSHMTVGVGFGGVPTTDAELRYLAAASGGPGQVIDLASGGALFEWEFGVSTLSRDGNRLLASGDGGLDLWDLSRFERRWTHPGAALRAWFSSDGRLVYGSDFDELAYVLDAATGQPLFELIVRDAAPLDTSMSVDNRRLATFSTDRTARVWSLAPTLSEGATYVHSQAPQPHPAAGADVAGGVAAVWSGLADRGDIPWVITVIDLNSGEILTTLAGGVPAVSPDASLLAYRSVDDVMATAEDLRGRGEPGVYPRVGSLRIIDLETGELVREIEVPCSAFLLPDEVVPSAGCIDIPPRWDLEFSSDGSLLAMAYLRDDQPTVWDVSTGQTIGDWSRTLFSAAAVALTPDRRHIVLGSERVRVIELESSASIASVPLQDASEVTEMVFTPDATLLVVADRNGDLVLIDASTWDQVDAIQAHRGGVLDAAVNPAGTLIASAGSDGFVRVWRVEDRSLYTEIGFHVDEIANVEFIDDTHLFVTAGIGNEAIVITLDPDELLNIARDRIVRTFTLDECSRFEINPCPTLAEVKSGSA
jgi:WD40 repeat protein